MLTLQYVEFLFFFFSSKISFYVCSLGNDVKIGVFFEDEIDFRYVEEENWVNLFLFQHYFNSGCLNFHQKVVCL